MVPLARMGTPVRITHGSSSCRKAQTSYKTKLFAKVLHLFSPTIHSGRCFASPILAIGKYH